MCPLDVPMGDRILPNENCELCGHALEILIEAGDDQDTVYIGCPNGDEDVGHTQHSGQPRTTLVAWGWIL